MSSTAVGRASLGFPEDALQTPDCVIRLYALFGVFTAYPTARPLLVGAHHMEQLVEVLVVLHPEAVSARVIILVPTATDGTFALHVHQARRPRGQRRLGRHDGCAPMQQQDVAQQRLRP